MEVTAPVAPKAAIVSDIVFPSRSKPVITTLLPEKGLGKTINDRLKRAVAN